MIKNASQKSIVYAMGQLRFPETGDATTDHLAVMDRISVGRRPEPVRSSDRSSRRSAAGLQPHIDGAEILVRPGQEIEVPVVDEFDAIKSGIEARRPLSGVTTCEIGFHTLYFDDGKSWLSGMYFRPDPSTPGKYIRISKQEFETRNGEASR